MPTTTTKAATTTNYLKPLTAAQLEKARITLSAGRHIACQKAPYFQSILLKLVVREHEPTPEFFTVGVSERFVLYACMPYVASLTPEEMAGDFVHEALHLFERHASRKGSRDHATWNQAGDLAINTIARDMCFKQTSIAIWPKDFGFEEHLAADMYYALLQKGGKGNGTGAGKGGTSTPGRGAPGRTCGSGAGNPFPGEPKTDPGERSDVDIEVAVQDAAVAVKAAASKNRGSVPAGLLLNADEALKPAQVHWTQHLRRAMRGSIAWASGAVDHRYDQPGRRQACLGYGHGRPVLPRLRRPVPNVAYALDTSGSMGHGDGSPLSDGCYEAMGVIKALGAEVQFLACDAAVHSVKKVGNIQELLACVRGGGGTSFHPIFKAAVDLRPRPHVLIVATDGEGPAPSAPPPGMRVIWLLIGANAPQPAPWGEVVRIS